MVTDAPVSTGIMESLIGDLADRRKRKRVAVQWPVQMWKSRHPVSDALTVNVSSGGFYCCSGRPFSPGDHLTALLAIPSPGSNLESQRLTLRCEVVVLRVETSDDGHDTGVACQIRDYSVLRAGGAPEELTCSDEATS
ncbi:MAG: PilZ domain-containing protein [Acidobacteriaceae bacterium]|nr:PilZ domain-containing protein [Acidobacteriaceae bacterium]